MTKKNTGQKDKQARDGMKEEIYMGQLSQERIRTTL